MGIISNKWLDDYYEKRPQLIPPPKSCLGWLVNDRIKPAIESLLNQVSEQSTQSPCYFCEEVINRAYRFCPHCGRRKKAYT